MKSVSPSASATSPASSARERGEQRAAAGDVKSLSLKVAHSGSALFGRQSRKSYLTR